MQNHEPEEHEYLQSARMQSAICNHVQPEIHKQNGIMQIECHLQLAFAFVTTTGSRVPLKIYMGLPSTVFVCLSLIYFGMYPRRRTFTSKLLYSVYFTKQNLSSLTLVHCDSFHRLKMAERCSST